MLNHEVLQRVVFGLLLACASADVSYAGPQKDAVCKGSCGGGCGPCPQSGNSGSPETSGNSGSSGTSGNSGSSGRSSSDRESRSHSGSSGMNETERAADQIDDEGLAAMKRGDYAVALEYFKTAYDKSQLERYAKVYRRHIARAKFHIAYEAVHQQADDAWNRGAYAEALNLYKEQQDLLDGPNVRDMIGRCEARLKAEETQRQTELERRQREVETINQIKQNAAKQYQKGSTASVGGLGINDDSVHPTVRQSPLGIDDDTVPAQGSDTKAGDQAIAASRSANLTTNYDRGGAKFVDSLPIARVFAQTPGTVALVASIPEPARNDREIKESITVYQHFDGLTMDTQAKLVTVQRQIDSHPSNTVALNAYKATLTNDLKRYKTYHEDVTKAIAEHLKKAYGVDWDEPGAAAAAKAGQ